MTPLGTLVRDCGLEEAGGVGMLCSFAAWLQIGGDANKVNISSEAAKLECIRISNASDLGKAQGTRISTTGFD
jgi:hypothetical protein